MSTTWPLNPDAAPDLVSGTRDTTPREPTAGERFALRVLQVGAIAVVLAASKHKLFELDRYFVPKDLVLHVTALFALFAVIRSYRTLPLRRVDALLLGYIG